MNEDTYRDKLNDLQLEVEELRAKLKATQTGDLISRQAALTALTSVAGVGNRALDKIRALPSAQPDNEDLIETIKNGITVSDGDGEYFGGLRNGMRWVLSIIDGKEPIYEPSAQPEPTMEEFMYGQDMGNPEDGSL